MRTKMWTQIVGASFFVIITIGEATGLLSPSFGIPMGWIIYAFAAAVMVFEAWRSWRKMKAETDTETDTKTS
jgi:uncharacterized membrane protein AbrB (regulator of aidB expression)